MALSDISPIASVIALVVSLFTLWLTVLRRGSVRSTRPSFIAFRYDFVGKEMPQAKIFFRSLLFSTGKRGQVIESLFMRVCEGSRQSEFSFWGHGDKELVRGSGLFIPDTGIATNHHFNPVDSDAIFRFSAGLYSIELVAKIVGVERLVSLWKVALEIPSGVFDTTIQQETAIFCNWSPVQQQYVLSIEKRSDSVHALSDPKG